ncbi:olfactory receptor-like protein OLF1 [Pelodytes ibericus]
MEDTNQTIVSGFILLGFSSVPHLQATFFSLFLLMYLTTLIGNILIITAVQLDSKLQTPMYFFLSNLAFIDICFSSAVVPRILVNTLAQDRSISVLSCAAQMFFHLTLGATECFLLAVMAYDRYAAICKPLHYNVIMNKSLCIGLTACSWTVSIINATIHVAFTFQLPYCTSRHVNHFFCEVPAFLRMSCTDTWFNEVAMYVSAIIIATCSFLLTLASYVHIISTILKIRSSQGRNKAFSTCASHLTVVFLYYGTIMFIYLRPRSVYSPDTDNAVSILYTVVTPMANPIIYSVRNKEVKRTIRRSLSCKMTQCIVQNVEFTEMGLLCRIIQNISIV